MPAAKKAATKTVAKAPTAAAPRQAAARPTPPASVAATRKTAPAPVPRPRWEEVPAPAWTPPAAPSSMPAPATQPTGKLARWMAIALAIQLAVSGILLLLDLAFDVPQGVQLAITPLTFGASVLCIVLVCMWVHRTLANARARDAAAGIRPGWAVGSFFIPVVQLFAPGLEVAKAWRADTGRGAGPVALWFVPWALAGIVLSVAVVFLMVTMVSQIIDSDVDPADKEAYQAEMDRIQDEATATMRPWNLAGFGLQLVAGIGLILLGLQWSRLQDHRAGAA